MNDRQPGAPGQYKAILTAAEFQKMQAGEKFTITMTRDDQPIVEGTPYSKAAVLPDELAKIICPDVLNPTPADAFRALLPRNGKAAMAANLPMGGYKVTGLGNPTANGDAVNLGYANGSFAPHGYGLGTSCWIDGGHTKFDDAAKLDDMKVNGFWTYQLSGSPLVEESADTQYVNGLTIATSKNFVTQIGCTLYSGYWIERRFVTRSGVGIWTPWKFRNPPLKSGVTYPTTEFFLGLTKYMADLSLGLGTAGGTMEVEHGISDIYYPISCDVMDYVGTKFTNVKFTPSSISFDVPSNYTGGYIHALISYALNE